MTTKTHEIKSLICNSCGAPIKNISTHKCSYCGTAFIFGHKHESELHDWNDYSESINEVREKEEFDATSLLKTFSL
jgi:ribosomal protein L37E